MNVYAGSVHAGSYSIWYLEVFCTLTLRSSTLPRYDALTFVLFFDFRHSHFRHFVSPFRHAALPALASSARAAGPEAPRWTVPRYHDDACSQHP